MAIPQNLRVIVRGGYDLQRLRIQVGNRLIGNFKAKLGQKPGESEDTLDDASKKLLATLRTALPKISDVISTPASMPEPDEDIDVDDENDDDTAKQAKAEKKVGKLITDLVNTRYKVVTEGRKHFPSRATFKGDPVISDYTELSLIAQYVDLERQEKQGFGRLETILQDYPIYTQFLEQVRGCGPMMSAVIISEIDIHKARHASSIWKYCGLDVAPDGRGRSRRKEHLVEREYTSKEGTTEKRLGITFSPFIKTKLIGVLGTSFIKQKGSEYDQVYRNYKNRMENHVVYGVANDGKVDEATGYKITSKGRRHAMAIRYTVKIFLLNLYLAWRKLEGLPVSQPYHEAKLGMHKHGA